MIATTEVTIVGPAAGLDGITAYWTNYEPGKGMVTLVCWGSAWNCYFGGMSGESIQQFFKGASTSYLVNKMTNAQYQKSTKAHEKYLARIVKAVQEANL